VVALYHVTRKANVEAILREGFEGGWGDVGYGVYVYDALGEAENYAASGGWDGEADPEDLAIIEITGAADEVEYVIPDPHWPNPEDYNHVLFHAMEDGERWRPDRKCLDDMPSLG
jgi:hypothetical protein